MLLRVAGGDHQALAPLGQVDDALRSAPAATAGSAPSPSARIRPIGTWKPATSQLPLLSEASASVLPQYLSSCGTSGAAQELVQRLDREAMAGVDAQPRRRGGHGLLDLGAQLRGQAVEHRRQPRLDAALGPDQPRAQRRQLRALAARHHAATAGRTGPRPRAAIARRGGRTRPWPRRPRPGCRARRPRPAVRPRAAPRVPPSACRIVQTGEIDT